MSMVHLFLPALYEVQSLQCIAVTLFKKDPHGLGVLTWGLSSVKYVHTTFFQRTFRTPPAIERSATSVSPAVEG